MRLSHPLRRVVLLVAMLRTATACEDSVEPSAGRAYPNEPAGAVATPGSPWVADFSAHFYDTRPEGAGPYVYAAPTAAQPWNRVGSGQDSYGQQVMFTVNDPAAPLNPTKVGAVRFNIETGSGPAINESVGDLKALHASEYPTVNRSPMLPPPASSSGVETGSIPLGSFYTSYYFKMVGNWHLSTHELKMINYTVMPGNPGFLVHVINTNGGDWDGPYTLGWYMGAQQPYWATNNIHGADIVPSWTRGEFFVTPGTWYHVETILDFANGDAYIYVDGELFRHTSASLADGGGSVFGDHVRNKTFSTMRFDHFTGGGDWAQTGAPSTGWFIYHDEFYTSYTIR